jgi:hypothetical protein
MDVVVATDPERAAIDVAVNAFHAAVLVAATREADHAALRHAIDRAAHTLATLTPKEQR